MGDLFALFLDLILKLWEGIGTIYEPFMDFIQMAADKVLPVLIQIATFLINAISSIIEVINGIIHFFTGDSPWGDGIGGGFGGGGAGGGGTHGT